MPTKTRFWHTCRWPAWQAAHSPHQRSGITVTGSPDAPAVDARSDGGDSPGHLVPDHGGDVDSPIHRAVPDVQVGPADPDEGHVEAHLARGRLVRLALADSEGPVSHVGRGEHR